MNLGELSCNVINSYGVEGYYNEQRKKITYSSNWEGDRIRIYEKHKKKTIREFTISSELIDTLISTGNYKNSTEVMVLISLAELWENGEVNITIDGENVIVQGCYIN